MEALISGLGVAAITGITILAYKHPHAYKKLNLVPLVFKIEIIFILVIQLWLIAVSVTYNKLIPFIEISKQTNAQKIVDTITISIYTHLIIVIGCLVLLAYLGFLLFLPTLLKKETKE